MLFLSKPHYPANAARTATSLNGELGSILQSVVIIFFSQKTKYCPNLEFVCCKRQKKRTMGCKKAKNNATPLRVALFAN